MKLLLDTCVWGGAVPELRITGHDVVWSGDWEEDPGDEAILAAAHEQRRILVTLDKDFGELAIVLRRPHGGILRLVDFSARQQAKACLQVLDAHGSELESVVAPDALGSAAKMSLKRGWRLRRYADVSFGPMPASGTVAEATK